MITKVADAPQVLKEWYSENEDLQNRALESFQKDLLAADIYETAVSHKFGIKAINDLVLKVCAEKIAKDRGDGF